jgi:hypothetical protein
MDDIIYFTASDAVERVDLKIFFIPLVLLISWGKYLYFWELSLVGLTIQMAMLLYILLNNHLLKHLIKESVGIDSGGPSIFLSPYHSGLPIDSVVHDTMSSEACNAL